MNGVHVDTESGAVVVDLGFGPVALDNTFIRDMQEFCDRRHDALMQTGIVGDRMQARALRQFSFALTDADIAAKRLLANDVLVPIPELRPLTCLVVRPNPELWGAR